VFAQLATRHGLTFAVEGSIFVARVVTNVQLLLDGSHGAVGGERAGALVAGSGLVGASAVRALGAAVEDAAEGAAGLVDAGPAVGGRRNVSAFVLAAWSGAT
jgi:hypothetical protein